ncbi:4'-phosphopantetheinyl transferase superfamily protein [Streptomyces sp. NPDC000987]|uniref:4'-phosphopantetheinyl transferase family protein n=1 Tax=Streptomyces sp. NPDC000987 TaxID=3154374 RepID=UPI003332A6B7
MAHDDAALEAVGRERMKARTADAADTLATAPYAPGSVAALFAPLPVSVGIARVGEYDHDELPAGLRLSGAGARRRAEFAAGRLAAHRALAAATGRGHWPARTATGAPDWPPGMHGSLSHSGTTAVCVVTAAPGPGPRIGIDIEPLASAAALHRARHLIARPAELTVIARSPAPPQRAVLTLFSAKEAAYKAAPPALQPRLSFRAVALAWSPDAAAPHRLRPAHGLPAALTVTSAVVADHVVSAAVHHP